MDLQRAERHTPMRMKVRLLLVASAAFAFAAAISAQKGAVRYEADLSWPKPLPERWALGGSAASAWTPTITC